jgi:UDP-N-acetylglucosamine 4,6-dehydratase
VSVSEPILGLDELAESSILVTGGTGSFGKAFLTEVLGKSGPDRVVIFSRDELKQYEMRATWGDDPRVRFFLGDIRDLERLTMAMRGIDYVVHAAALKQVDTAEYNPMEFVKTNVLGSENVIQAAIANRVKKVVALSTDKASSPVNLYGATKLTADNLFISSNHYVEAGGTRFAVVRYGNVMASRGSVIPLFQDLASRGEPLPITDARMTRFWITLPQAVQFVIDSFTDMKGGELYVPRIPSMKVTDLAEAIAPGSELMEIGIRPGEKLHEEMIASADAPRTLERSDRYVVAPTLAVWGGYRAPAGTPVAEDFSYSSDKNDSWLSVGELREMLHRL